MIINLRRELLGSVFLAGTALLPLAAAAQSNNNSSVETVVVTAEKRPEALINVPMSITVVGQDLLNNLNIRSFDEIAAHRPGNVQKLLRIAVCQRKPRTLNLNHDSVTGPKGMRYIGQRE